VPYSQVFNDHLANPRNAGELPDPTAIGEETNPVCGDRLRLALQIDDGRITAVRFLAYGCPPTLVCGSVLTELVQGKSVEAARRLTRDDIIAAIDGLPSRKKHAASLALETLRSTLPNVR
jgi:NifU-like protein involved in Fe-S cluster formation